MKFTEKLEHQRQVLARIYGKKPSYPFDRLTYHRTHERPRTSNYRLINDAEL